MELEGLDNVLRNLSKLEPKKWKRKVMKELRADHKEVRSTMRGAAPVDTGKLKRSIRTNAWMKQRRNGDLDIYVRTGPRYRKPGRVWYAHFVELGTTKKEGVHFIEGTFNQYKTALEEGMKQAIRNVVKQANG